ncbi:MarC family protein [Adhaeretor mobilis]|uniref:UPF0056 membrane protein n=1 Tax=Adhaeretor mobilis TaxID=1930276 RepID=A0A517MY86_9BACT|nr:MarC family protein [Adhaeretor mobilis]QDS99842.1 putative antibiotic transporter [Adhaeretor mobilis]
MTDFVRAVAILLALLNPFLVIVCLLDVVQTLDRIAFRRVLLRAALIAAAVFGYFALAGDALLTGIIQADFASFQVFGGIVFLLIGLQFVFSGPTGIEMLRGEPEYLSDAIAMPVLIGPGTLSASVIVGKTLSPLAACGAIIVALMISVAVMILLKVLHDMPVQQMSVHDAIHRFCRWERQSAQRGWRNVSGTVLAAGSSSARKVFQEPNRGESGIAHNWSKNVSANVAAFRYHGSSLPVARLDFSRQPVAGTRKRAGQVRRVLHAPDYCKANVSGRWIAV